MVMESPCTTGNDRLWGLELSPVGVFAPVPTGEVDAEVTAESLDVRHAMKIPMLEPPRPQRRSGHRGGVMRRDWGQLCLFGWTTLSYQDTEIRTLRAKLLVRARPRLCFEDEDVMAFSPRII